MSPMRPSASGLPAPAHAPLHNHPFASNAGALPSATEALPSATEALPSATEALPSATEALPSAWPAVAGSPVFSALAYVFAFASDFVSAWFLRR